MYSLASILGCDLYLRFGTWRPFPIRSDTLQPKFTVLLQRGGRSSGSNERIKADLMEERRRGLQVIAESDEARTEVAEMTDIVRAYLT
jgi:hypothetical protein